MAAMILIYLNVHRLGIRMRWIQRHVFLAAALFGGIGGLLAGTVNVMLPALIIFALEMNLTPLITVQIFNFSFFFGKLSQGAVLVSRGYIDGSRVLSAIPLICVALAALALGMHYRDRIKSEVYRLWLRRILAAITILLIFQYFGLL